MIKFGVAGNSRSFYDDGYKSTLEAGAWCKDKCIDVFEYSFGKGVVMSNPTAIAIGKEFAQQGVELTVHAPYFINFANESKEMIQKSVGYIISSLEKLELMGGNRLVFHPAAQGKLTREDAVERTKKNLSELAVILSHSGFKEYIICPEAMGKEAQIGTVEETVAFANLAEFYYPCMDFGHINARTGGSLKAPEDFEKIIRYMFDNLPEDKVKNMHVHFSKIMYGNKGELKHLTFEDTVYGPEFSPFCEVVKKYNLTPYIICESDGTQAEDAIFMKKHYYGLH